MSVLWPDGPPGDRTQRRRELREHTMRRASHRCEWPQCDRRAVEMAHIESVGMGGRRSADNPFNVFAACRDHARVSDGLPPDGTGPKGLASELVKIPGVMPPPKGTRWSVRDWRPHLIAYLLDRWST